MNKNLFEILINRPLILGILKKLYIKQFCMNVQFLKKYLWYILENFFNKNYLVLDNF